MFEGQPVSHAGREIYIDRPELLSPPVLPSGTQVVGTNAETLFLVHTDPPVDIQCIYMHVYRYNRHRHILYRLRIEGGTIYCICT